MLSRRTFGSAATLVLSCVVGNTMLVIYYLEMWRGHIGWDSSGWQMLFPGLFVATCLALTYSAAAALVNRTVVSIDAESIRVRNTPLPWLDRRAISRRAVRAVTSEAR